MFTSDNGLAELRGPAGRPCLRKARELRSTAGSASRSSRGGRADPRGIGLPQLAVTFDLLPANGWRARTGPGRTIDGRDTGLLSGAQCRYAPRRFFTILAGGSSRAQRQWKLHAPHKYRNLAGEGGGGWPGPYESGDRWALFDLETDIGETTDVADTHPDVVDRLKTLIEAFEKDIKDNARPAGRV